MDALKCEDLSSNLSLSSNSWGCSGRQSPRAYLDSQPSPRGKHQVYEAPVFKNKVKGVSGAILKVALWPPWLPWMCTYMCCVPTLSLSLSHRLTKVYSKGRYVLTCWFVIRTHACTLCSFHEYNILSSMCQSDTQLTLVFISPSRNWVWCMLGVISLCVLS